MVQHHCLIWIKQNNILVAKPLQYWSCWFSWLITKNIKLSLVNTRQASLDTKSALITLGNKFFPWQVLSSGINKGTVKKSKVDKKQQALLVHLFGISDAGLIILFS